jgi:hypothetical protein
MTPRFFVSLIAVPLLIVVSLPAFGQTVEPVSSLPTEWIARAEDPIAPDLPTGGPVSADVLAGEDALSEVSIDVNPTNGNNQVIVGHSSGFTTMNTFFTMDGGVTWTPVSLGDVADGLTSTFRFDPTVAFDDDGNVYVGYGVRTPAPGGGNQRTVVVCRSADGGATYPQCISIDTNPDIGSLPGNDKWHLATGPDPGNLAQRNVYIAWTKNVTEGGSTDQRIVVSRSTDGGVTWSAALTINDGSIAGTQSGNLFADPAVGPNGELYVAWHDIGGAQVWVDISLDGGATFGTDVLVATSATGFKTSIPAQPDRGVHVGPTIDADRSGGPFDGRLYLTYTDVGGSLPDVDVLTTYSTDGGVTWSAPVIVHDDGTILSQFLPWLDVDQATGIVTTVWYDARNDANNKQVDVYLAASFDGGVSWEPNIKVSDLPSDQSTDNGSRYLGNFLEYIGVANLEGMAFPAWADNSQSLNDLDYFTDQILINTRPTADAGPDQMVECADVDGTPVTLDGSLSSDSDMDTLTYTWTEGGSIIAGPTMVPTVDATLDPGVHTITLTVDDGRLMSDTDEVEVTIVDTTAPTIVLLGDNPMTLECSEEGYIEPGATITDNCDPNPGLVIDSSAVDPSTTGTYEVTYTGTDANGNSDTVIRLVNVEDTLPPVIIVESDPIVLWPPNHKYQTVGLVDVVTGISDSCDTGLTTDDVLLTSASSDEPEDANGDGSTLNDIVIQTDCRAVSLRKERQGGGNGRVYTLNLGVADATGNEGTNDYQVVVPHDQNSSPLAVDDGPVYVESGCSPSDPVGPPWQDWIRFKKRRR